jgi:hypothetical protein
VSAKIEEVLQIVHRVDIDRSQTPRQVRNTRMRGFDKVAVEQRLPDNTRLHRACRDRLGNQSIRDFDRLIYRWLCQGDNAIRTHLEIHASQHAQDCEADQQAIAAFFERYQPWPSQSGELERMLEVG